MDALTRAFRVRKTCLEMLGDRGYLIVQVLRFNQISLVLLDCRQAIWGLKLSCAQSDVNMTKEGFAERFTEDPKKDDLTLLAPRQDDPTDQASLCCILPFAAS